MEDGAWLMGVTKGWTTCSRLMMEAGALFPASVALLGLFPSPCFRPSCCCRGALSASSLNGHQSQNLVAFIIRGEE